MDTKNNDNFLSTLNKYWKIVLGFFGAILALVLFKQSRKQKILKNAKESHKKELDVIDRSISLERDSKDRALDKFNSEVKEIEEQFIDDKKSIQEKKKEETKVLIEKNEEQPDTIAREISELINAEFKKPE